MSDVYQMLADALRERDELKARVEQLEGSEYERTQEEYRQHVASPSRARGLDEVSQRVEAAPEEIQARSLAPAVEDREHPPAIPYSGTDEPPGAYLSREPPQTAATFPVLSEPPTRQPEGGCSNE